VEELAVELTPPKSTTLREAVVEVAVGVEITPQPAAIANVLSSKIIIMPIRSFMFASIIYITNYHIKRYLLL
jgi:large-conductance mechanosensitive channel